MFMQKKGYNDSPLEFLLSEVPKSFVGEPFDVPEKFGYRKIYT